MHEMPDLFRMGDRWYLLTTEYSDRSKTVYRSSESLAGPWTSPVDDAFDGRAYYAGAIGRRPQPPLSVRLGSDEARRHRPRRLAVGRHAGRARGLPTPGPLARRADPPAPCAQRYPPPRPR